MEVSCPFIAYLKNSCANKNSWSYVERFAIDIMDSLFSLIFKLFLNTGTLNVDNDRERCATDRNLHEWMFGQTGVARGDEKENRTRTTVIRWFVEQKEPEKQEVV